MNKELSNNGVIIEKSKSNNRKIQVGFEIGILNIPSKEHFLAYKNSKSKCNNLIKQPKKKYVKNICDKKAAIRKSFWNTVKPFITHKGIKTNENMTTEQRKVNRQRSKAHMKKLI